MPGNQLNWIDWEKGKQAHALCLGRARGNMRKLLERQEERQHRVKQTF